MHIPSKSDLHMCAHTLVTHAVCRARVTKFLFASYGTASFAAVLCAYDEVQSALLLKTPPHDVSWWTGTQVAATKQRRNAKREGGAGWRMCVCVCDPPPRPASWIWSASREVAGAIWLVGPGNLWALTRDKRDHQHDWHNPLGARPSPSVTQVWPGGTARVHTKSRWHMLIGKARKHSAKPELGGNQGVKRSFKRKRPRRWPWRRRPRFAWCAV